MALIYRTQQQTEVYANSGYWRDIQNAVDQAVSTDAKNVHIPEGIFNFINVGETWTGARVTCPAGINLFGAPTERDANGQVIEWKTVLVMPWDVPGNDTVGIPEWFHFSGSQDPNKPSRFSDIKLVGYRDIDPNSKSLHFAIIADGVINFRIDHCYFRHTTAGILTVRSCGVIDHCKFVNVYGVPYGPDGEFSSRTIGYGVAVNGDWNSPLEWETDVSKVLGQYTNYSVYVEDCYFSKWRHCAEANTNGHVILRHSIVDKDFAYGSVDIHGGTDSSVVGGRAVEVYENIFKDPDPNWNLDSVSFHRGGAGVYFNNTVSGSPRYAWFVSMINEGSLQQCWVNNVWIWNNSVSQTALIQVVGQGITENINYYLHAPHTFTYTPYPYPHPLTLEAPTTPWMGTLEEGTYKITMPSQVQVGSDVYNFKKWEDGSTNPVRTINLTSDMTVTATYELQVPVEYTLTIATTAGGTTSPAPSSYRYTTGSTVTVTAFPDTNYSFSYWTLNGTRRTENPITITMDKDYTLMAVFEYVPPPVYHTLIISATSGGSTNPAPGRYDYLEGTSVTVAALPDTNYRFSHWELDGAIRTENPITITMDRDYSLRAVFEYVPPPPLTATVRGVVKDAKTAQPIAGAIVTCNGYADVTEIDGSYELTDIPAAVYALTVQKEGYQTQTASVDASSGGTFEKEFNLSLTPPTPPAVGILATWGFPVCSRFPNAPPCPIILNWAKRKGYIKEGA